jgi:hypothetical protein
MKNIIETIKELGTKIALLSCNESLHSSRMTDRELAKKIVETFKRAMDDWEEVPKNIFINLHENDFRRLKLVFPAVVIKTRKELYNIVEKNKTRYEDYGLPHHWYFEFFDKEDWEFYNCEEDEADINITEGKPYIYALVRVEEEKHRQSDSHPDDTGKTKDNRRAMTAMIGSESGIWNEDKRTFTPAYAPLRNTSDTNSGYGTNKRVIACLKASTGDKFDMRENVIVIAGNNDTTSKLPETVFKLNTPLDPKRYAEITYNPNEANRFSIKAFGKLTLKSDNKKQTDNNTGTWNGHAKIVIPDKNIEINFTPNI